MESELTERSAFTPIGCRCISKHSRTLLSVGWVLQRCHLTGVVIIGGCQIQLMRQGRQNFLLRRVYYFVLSLQPSIQRRAYLNKDWVVDECSMKASMAHEEADSAHQPINNPASSLPQSNQTVL